VREDPRCAAWRGTSGLSDDRRDRRDGRGGGRRVHPGAREEARRRLHLRPDGAARPAHGARGRDHRGWPGDGGREDEGARDRRRDARPEPGGHGRDRGDSARPVSVERTLAIIKPDAIAKGVAGQIVTRIENAGFKILAAKLIRMSHEDAAGFYVVHKARPFYRSLCTFMTQGPSLPNVLD